MILDSALIDKYACSLVPNIVIPGIKNKCFAMNLPFQNGEWIFDNLNSITQLGFNVDPPKVRLQKLLLNLHKIRVSDD